MDSTTRINRHQGHLFPMAVEQVVSLLRAECKKQGGPKEWARINGLSPAYVADVMRGEVVDPSPLILSPLGVKREVTYWFAPAKIKE